MCDAHAHHQTATNQATIANIKITKGQIKRNKVGTSYSGNCCYCQGVSGVGRESKTSVCAIRSVQRWWRRR